MEIERKFLVKQLPDFIKEIKPLYIEQHYISINPEVRVRNTNDNIFVLTMKTNGNMVRNETEISITKDTYYDLIKNSLGSIKKKRFVYRDDNNVYEVDIYSGFHTGLMIVEVEFLNEQEASNFIPLCWFGREVTIEQQYKNRNLALKGVVTNV